MLHALGRTRCPPQPYTSIQLNELRAGEQIKAHFDDKNEGGSSVISWGDYSGGTLQVCVNGVWHDRQTRHSWTKLEEGVEHRVSEVLSGVRYSAVYYKPFGHEQCLSGDLGSKLRMGGYVLDPHLHDPSSLSDEAGCSATVSGQIAAQQCSEATFHHVSGGPKAGTKNEECKEREGVEERKKCEDHRKINEAVSGPLLSACIVRQIFPSDPEFRSPGCKKALDEEVSKICEKGTWDSSDVMELAELKRHPKLREALIGRAFVIMGEKYAEEKRQVPTYKARLVFAGNNVSTITGTPAHELYKQLGSSPACMGTARAVAGVCSAFGHRLSMRDVSQAYLQSDIDGEGRTPTYIILPREVWPDCWFDDAGNPLYKTPVCRLKKALYGHPESGAVWEKHLEKVLRKLGWRSCDGIASTWIRENGHGKCCSCLVVYVDDLLLGAPDEEQKRIWKELEGELDFKEPPEPLQRYLGANHQVTSRGGLTTMKVSMQSMLSSALKRFSDELGTGIRVVSTPFVTDEVCCSELDDQSRVRFRDSAASHVASLLYIARMARPDLLVAVVRLSRYVSRWDANHDAALVRLFGYIKGTLELEMTFSIQEGKPFEVRVWSDADLCGNPDDTKSTTGVWIELHSPGSGACWPIAWVSKRQGASAFSTCESEVVAMSYALREEGLPLLDLIRDLTGKDAKLVCKEDNTQAISAIERGYSKKLRHIPRVHKVSLGALHELLASDERIGRIEHHPTASHKADLFTKALEKNRFELCRELVGMEFRSSEGGVEAVRGTSQNACLGIHEQECLCMDRFCEQCGSLFV